jgi:hypothetical protein
VFFDYEGAWSISILGRPPISYPQPLRLSPKLGSPAVRLGHGQVRTAFRDFLSPQSVVPRSSGVGNPLTAIRQREWERRFRKRGWATHRFLLRPHALPPLSGLAVTQTVLVTGRLRDPTTAPSLLSRLHQKAGISPFLFAFDNSRALLGALGSSSHRNTGHESVLDVLGVDLVPLPTLKSIIDFRLEQVCEGSVGSRNWPPKSETT